MTPRRIETGRTWRDLPPAPPTSFVPAPVMAPEQTEVVSTRLNPWPYVAGGLAVVLVGFVVGLVLPRPSASTPDGARTTTTTTLPAVIVPPPPTSLPESSEPAPELDVPGPAIDEIFALPEPPEGFRVAANVRQATPDRVDQDMVITNDTFEVRIRAVASALDPTVPQGEPVTVRGEEGRLVQAEDGGFTLAWIEPGKIAFAIEAPDQFGVDAAIALAESLEVR